MSDPRTQPERAPQRRGAAVGVIDEPQAATDDNLCACCEPRNPLVMRPDFGTLGDGSAEYALCVLHEPNPVVYRNRGDGAYVPAPGLSLNAAGELIDESGEVIARVSGDGFQRLSTVDDDDELPPDGGGGAARESQGDTGAGVRPSPHYVDLSQDDFYSPR